MSRLLRAESQSEQAQLDAARRSMEAISRQLLALAQKDPYNVDRKMDLTWVFRALADNATARKDWPEAMRLLDTANNHATQAIAAAPSDIILQREKAWIMYRQAAVQVGAGHARQAAVAATQTRVEFARLVRAAPSDLVLQSDLVLAIHAERDALADAKDEAGAARAASQHRRALAGALRALPASGTLQTEAYWADLRDGDRFSIVKQPERALAFFRTALEHISRATQIDPDNALWWQWRYQAASRCSEMLAKLKRWDEAEQSDRVGLAAIENASKLLPRSPEVADKLGTSHLSLGRDLASLGRLEAALAEFDKAYEAATLATQLGSDVSAYRDRRREVVDEMARTTVLQKDRDGYQRIFTNAGRSERRALEGLRDEKIRTARTIEVIEWHIRAGQAHAEKKEADDALGRYAMARRWIDRGIADAADDTPLIAQLSRLQRLVGEQMAAKGDAAGQMAALKEGLDALVKESERRSDAASFEALRDYHHVMADAYASTKQWEDAESQWQAGADAGVHAAELGQTADHYNAAALSLYRLGNFYDTRGSWERAASAYGRAIAELEIAVQKDPKGVLHRIGMSACRRRLGLALEAQKRPQEARFAFKEAIAAATEALTLEPDAGEQLQHLYLAQWRLADNYANAGLADDANVLYEFAKENAVRAAKKKPADTGIPVDIDALRSHRSADVEPR
jgi:tetratricopeptide (TPR) repeat protein